MKIGNKEIGEQFPTYIIAEIGLNHGGDIVTAKQLINVAAEAKVSAVKFQKRCLPFLYSQEILDNPNNFEQSFQYIIPLFCANKPKPEAPTIKARATASS